MNSNSIYLKIKNDPNVVKSLDMAERYYIKINSVRNEILGFRVFADKAETVKLDIGFDTGFRNPVSDLKSICKKMIVVEQKRNRAVELEIQMRKIYNRLSYLYDHTKNYVYFKYGTTFSYMKKDFYTSLVDYVLTDVIRHRDLIKELLDDISSSLKMLDSVHFCLLGIKQSGELIVQRSSG